MYSNDESGPASGGQERGVLLNKTNTDRIHVEYSAYTYTKFGGKNNDALEYKNNFRHNIHLAAGLVHIYSIFGVGLAIPYATRRRGGYNHGE